MADYRAGGDFVRWGTRQVSQLVTVLAIFALVSVVAGLAAFHWAGHLRSASGRRIGRAKGHQPVPGPLVTVHRLAEATIGTQRRILVVEDNPVNQKVAAIMLKKIGCDIAPDGVEALEALRQRSYHLILMDCQMPRMDGYEATQEIRRREGATAHTPIVAMTANAIAGDRERCLDVGMDDYLSKPVKLADLRVIVQQMDRSGRLVSGDGPAGP